ncbi:MAG: hypothetical protein ACRDPY_31100 [Streptosporangiaceae bacterium]
MKLSCATWRMCDLVQQHLRDHPVMGVEHAVQRLGQGGRGPWTWWGSMVTGLGLTLFLARTRDQETTWG